MSKIFFKFNEGNSGVLDTVCEFNGCRVGSQVCEYTCKFFVSMNKDEMWVNCNKLRLYKIKHLLKNKDAPLH